VSTLSVWAPNASGVRVVAGDSTAGHTEHPMARGDDGWWTADVPDGVDYAYLLDDAEAPVPDPRSVWQPHGVHGPTRPYDHSRFPWSDQGWTGRALPGSLVYELHVGTFTPAGTFDAAAGHLDHLVDLGVDLVEVMPVNAFDGTHGWGYDGVLWYAVHEPYGGPDGLKRFVDACHARGLGVVLDVVYNHLGPSGAYLDRFGPYFSEHHHTPWGPGLNLDGPHSDVVRSYVLDNALSWFRDFHVDGLRLDAVHALSDDRATHLLEELASEVDALEAHLRRPLTLIAESDLNDPRLVTAREAGGHGLDAQWADDVHHALHTALTGERQGYYADFGSLSTLAATLRSPFFHAGSWSSFRGRLHGRAVDTSRVPGYRFVVYTSDHDQVGNRATGDRPSHSQSPGLLAVAAALVLTSAYTPMLFMGEEWGASTPWQFFTSFDDPELGDAVRDGRRSEFGEHGWDSDEVPDPQDPATRDRSVLDWAEPGKDHHAWLLDVYRRLVALRRSRPDLTDPRLDRVEVTYDEDERWLVVHRGTLRVVANLGTSPRRVTLDREIAEVLLASADTWVEGDEVAVDGESFAVVTTR
jgi:maltooligosyltrehalose trehalohydrolase